MKQRQKGLSLVVLIFVLAIAGMIIVGYFKKNPVTGKNNIETGIDAENRAKGVVNELEAHQQINQNAINQ